jgi:hypothetical protein
VSLLFANSIYRINHLDRIGHAIKLLISELAVRAGYSASFAGGAWFQRIVSRTISINRTGVSTGVVIDNGQWPPALGG